MFFHVLHIKIISVFITFSQYILLQKLRLVSVDLFQINFSHIHNPRSISSNVIKYIGLGIS